MKTYTFTIKTTGKVWRIVARNYEIACMVLKVLTHVQDEQFRSQYVKAV